MPGLEQDSPPTQRNRCYDSRRIPNQSMKGVRSCPATSSRPNTHRPLSRLLSNNRPTGLQILKAVVAKLGGSVDSFWFCFGEYDVLGIVTLPDNVAVALSMGIGASGAFQDGKGTPLLSVEEGMAAMTKAGSIAY